MTRGIKHRYGRQHFEELKNLSKDCLQTLQDETNERKNTWLPRLFYSSSATNKGRWGKHKSILIPSRYFSQPYLHYAFSMAKNLILTLYFNWTMLFYAPLSFLACVIVYPSCMTILLILELVLKLLLEVFGGNSYLLYLSHQYGKGLSMINWGRPEFLLSKDTANQVRKTIKKLGSSLTPEDRHYKTFDISIAQTMTLLSAVIYERDDGLVKEAYETLVATNYEELINNDDDVETPIEKSMRRLLRKSEANIRSIVKHWGLRFEGITELKSMAGPLCGLFWSEVHPVAIVCFKGTTPTNYEEFLVDCSIQRVDARPYLFGAAHQGFYDSVFPTTDFGDSDRRDPYQAILNSIHEKAQMYHHGKQTQVWICGHSLGAAASSLLFARWIKSPHDLKESMVLRDSYVIGSPAVGDNDFAAEFASYSNSPIDRQSTLWRIVNQFDIIPRVPPGYNNRIFGRFVSKWDFFNYTHIGHEVRIPINHTRPLVMKPSSFQSPTKIRIIRGSDDRDHNDVKDECESTTTNSSSSSSSPFSYFTKHLLDNDNSDNEDNDDGDHSSLELASLRIKSTYDYLTHIVDKSNTDNEEDDDEQEEDDIYLNDINNNNNYKDEIIENSPLYKWVKRIHNKFYQINERYPLLNKYGKTSFVNPIQVIEYLYPRLIHDHLPFEYYQGLERAKEFY
ncbi:Alpha/Beta hydrolase protein [Cunninghamella echinulata]|nr:Alpha/Beta hydrolase protein [Cunninghamella echinulata]